LFKTFSNMSEQIFNYGTDHLTANIALAIGNGNLKGVLSPAVREKVIESSKVVECTGEADAA